MRNSTFFVFCRYVTLSIHVVNIRIEQRINIFVTCHNYEGFVNYITALVLVILKFFSRGVALLITPSLQDRLSSYFHIIFHMSTTICEKNLSPFQFILVEIVIFSWYDESDSYSSKNARSPEKQAMGTNSSYSKHNSLRSTRSTKPRLKSKLTSGNISSWVIENARCLVWKFFFSSMSDLY